MKISHGIAPECIAPDRHPRRPEFTLPAGAIDTHVHVFEEQYPLAETRGYTPPESTLADLQHLHQILGFDRVVLTQASPHGTDNSAISDATTALNKLTPGRAKMVVALASDVTEHEIARLDQLGACGVRLNTDNKGGMPITLDKLPELEAKLKPFGWHIEWLFPGANIIELLPVFDKMTIPMSIAHFAYQPAAAGIEAPGFKALLDLVKRGNTWVKISAPNRISATDLPPYDDVRPMAQALCDTDDTRILWGSDWPHPDRYNINPNDGDLVNALYEWVPDEKIREKILCSNPETFYRF